MLSYIEFEKYRIFSGKQSLRLAPLTVVFGKNNTGKSAVLKLPMLIRSAVCCESDEVFSKKDESGLIICDEYRDVIYGKGNHAVGLKLCDDSGDVEVNLKFIAENQAGRSHSRLEELIIKDHQQELHVSSDDDNILREELTKSALTFQGTIPKESPYRDLANMAYKQLEMAIDYIGPVRWKPERYLSFDEHQDKNSGDDGKKAYFYLVQDSQNAVHPLLDNVSKWYEDNFGGWKLDVEKSRYPVFSIELRNNNLSNNICDTGFGIQQSLPIVVAACRQYDKPTLIVLEEPETHLNPSAHAQMGELLANSAKADTAKRFLVETHSLNFMIRLRTLIAKGVLKREDVALYFVEYNENANSSSLREVKIDEKGDVEGWPEEMFKETLSEALALRQAQMSKK